MTTGGPRPERPEIAAGYEKELPEFALRLQAKAGLTGYAQVYGKYNTTPYDKLQMDLMYIVSNSHRSGTDDRIFYSGNFLWRIYCGVRYPLFTVTEQICIIMRHQFFIIEKP